ncbi:MAG: PEP-CTERM sorting domain-containing protein [Gammaproteobacteria bacterium]|nr:PEP-CTERM sorting domain-containing protein [Gammaproteobacteria bacterium]
MLKKILPVLFLFAGFQVQAVITDNGIIDGFDTFKSDVDGSVWIDLDAWEGYGFSNSATLMNDLSATLSGTAFVLASSSDVLNMISDSGLDNPSLSWVTIAGVIGLSGPPFYNTWTGAYTADTSASDQYMVGAGSSSAAWSAEFQNVSAQGAPTAYGIWARASSTVPEPSIIALFGVGLIGLGCARRRKSCKA